jgi:hypothetical protein
MGTDSTDAGVLIRPYIAILVRVVLCGTEYTVATDALVCSAATFDGTELASAAVFAANT